MRGSMLHGWGHFVTVVRTTTAWMHYDGLLAEPSFEFFAFKEGRKAMGGFRLDLVSYEVVNENIVKLSNDPNHDWSKSFHARNGCGSLSENAGPQKTHEQPDEDNRKAFQHQSMYEFLAEMESSGSESLDLSENKTMKGHKQQATNNFEVETENKGASQQELINLHKETTPRKRSKKKSSVNAKMQKKKNAKAKTSKRVPQGFSLRTTTQTRGQRPICRGCRMEIDYAEDCICHKHKANANHLHPTVDQFHCRPFCLSKMKEEHLLQFLIKNWVEKKVVVGVKELIENERSNNRA